MFKTKFGNCENRKGYVSSKNLFKVSRREYASAIVTHWSLPLGVNEQGFYANNKSKSISRNSVATLVL